MSVKEKRIILANELIAWMMRNLKTKGTYTIEVVKPFAEEKGYEEWGDIWKAWAILQATGRVTPPSAKNPGWELVNGTPIV